MKKLLILFLALIARNVYADDNWVNGAAKAVGVMPGAVICPTYDLAQYYFDSYINVWNEKMSAKQNPSYYHMQHGNPPDYLNPNALGCVFVNAGQPVKVLFEKRIPVPKVKAVVNGKQFIGYALPPSIHIEKEGI